MQEIRLLAVVTAKNAVGSSCSKSMSQHEWSKVSEEEKQTVRTAAFARLLNDPSPRIAVQLSLFIANMSKYDFPTPWSTLLSDLINIAMSNTAPIPQRLRVLKTLKHVLVSLQSKQFMIGNTTGFINMSNKEFEELFQSMDEERNSMFDSIKAHFVAIRSSWEEDFGCLLNKSQPDWEQRGELAVALFAVLREMLAIVPNITGIERDFAILMQKCAEAATACAGPLFSPGQSELEENQERHVLSKGWERILQIGLLASNKFPIKFAPHLPSWIAFCINIALFGMDAAAVHHIRPKSRVFLIRFVARALLQSYYNTAAAPSLYGIGTNIEGVVGGMSPEQAASVRQDLQRASESLDALVSTNDGHCDAVVQAIISKYLVLSPKDLSEWANDPESLARQVADVESSPESDTPIHCGVALLQCLLERSDENVTNSLLGMASQLQSQQKLTVDNILLREAAYRAVGECFLHIRHKVNFNDWYKNELRGILQQQQQDTLGGVFSHDNVIKARALWLIGVCGEELLTEAWDEAFTLAVQYIQSPDLVQALQAVTVVTALLGNVLEEERFIAQPEDTKQLLLQGMEPVIPYHGAANDDEAEDINAKLQAEFNAHTGAIARNVDNIMNNCFALLPRLEEVESMVSTLVCVSVTIEVMGEKVQPHLGSITGALPRVWSVINARQGEGTGALARLHSALISTLTHVISKLGGSALSEEHFSSVILPLLLHATSLGSAETEPLVDDGLKLWYALLRSTDTLPPQLNEMLAQRLPSIINKGQDSTMAYKILEGHLLRVGPQCLAPLMDMVGASINKSLQPVLSAHVVSNGTSNMVGPDAAHEAGVALALTLRLIQANDYLVASSLQAAVTSTAAILGRDFGGGISHLPARCVTIVQGCIQVLAHIVFKQPSVFPSLIAAAYQSGVSSNGQEGGNGALVGQAAAATATIVEQRLVDRWLIFLLARDISELYVPVSSMHNKIRRHRGTVALCTAIYADVSPAMHSLERATKALVLCTKVVDEREMYLKSEEFLHNEFVSKQGVIDNIVKVGLEKMVTGDVFKTVDSREATRAAASKIFERHGKEVVLKSVETIDPMYRERLEEILSLNRDSNGGVGGDSSMQ
jgi:hypothetical protein